ncbi:hypothetical protein GHT06_018585 [Daphnia sinensis]|uniref:Uncharacterized protein n=1 Tax=Daphnia sinensis TaxID=1820382 RepID=A0AAD5PT91_9CRUS|nr:hypothetical protein GHT06_018585 [Daphnia sinensis]
MAKVKGLDGSLMPPCKTVLLEQIKRANSICSIWNKATASNPIAFAPNNNGWSLVDNKYSICWFQGDCTPSSLDDMLVNESDETSDDEPEYESEVESDSDNSADEN